MVIYVWQVVLVILVVTSIWRFVYIVRNTDERGNVKDEKWYDGFVSGVVIFMGLLLFIYIIYIILSYAIPFIFNVLSMQIYP